MKFAIRGPLNFWSGPALGLFELLKLNFARPTRAGHEVQFLI